VADGGEDKEESGGKNEHEEINGGEAGGRDGAKESDRKTEHDADVEDVAAENVADGKLGFALFGGSDGSDELGEGGAESDDGESDDALRDAKSGGEGDGGVNYEVATKDDAGETQGGEAERSPKTPTRLLPLVFVAGVERHRDEIIKKNGKEEEDGDTVRAGDDVFWGGVERDVEKEDDEQAGNQDANRDFFADGFLFDGERMNHGGEAEDEENVQNIATDDVAKDEVSRAGGDGFDRDGELWRGSAKRDDSEANERLANLEVGSSRGSTVDEEVGPLDEEDEAEN